MLADTLLTRCTVFINKQNASFAHALLLEFLISLLDSVVAFLQQDWIAVEFLMEWRQRICGSTFVVSEGWHNRNDFFFMTVFSFSPSVCCSTRKPKDRTNDEFAAPMELGEKIIFAARARRGTKICASCRAHTMLAHCSRRGKTLPIGTSVPHQPGMKK